jgi:hypothetical protein
MSRIFITMLVSLLLPAGQAAAGCMDTDNSFWLSASSQPTYDKLMSTMACPVDADQSTGTQVDAVACNYFVAKALDTLYGVKDFTPDVSGHWLTADEIVAYVRSHSDSWAKLGMANDQGVLNDAANGAANGQPVIAAITGDPHGHVALVLGGDLKPSTNWKLNVPNSAAFKLADVDKAYVFCRLSFAFHSPDGVEIYWRVK